MSMPISQQIEACRRFIGWKEDGAYDMPWNQALETYEAHLTHGAEVASIEAAKADLASLRQNIQAGAIASANFGPTEALESIDAIVSRLDAVA